MKDNILIAVFLVVGLLTPVFGWLFYCWFRSHVTSQHLQGQVFHRRSRDRTQASWHPGNGDTMHSTLGPHFTPHGWVRPKPYGETNALPLSHSEERRPARTHSPRTIPSPRNQQPNPLSKRQQKKLRAKQNKQKRQQQGQSNQNSHNNQNHPKQKNKNNNQGKAFRDQHWNRDQSQDRSYRRSPREEIRGYQNSPRSGGREPTPDDVQNNNNEGEGESFNLGALYDNTEDEHADGNSGGQKKAGWGGSKGDHGSNRTNEDDVPDNKSWKQSLHGWSNRGNEDDVPDNNSRKQSNHDRSNLDNEDDVPDNKSWKQNNHGWSNRGNEDDVPDNNSRKQSNHGWSNHGSGNSNQNRSPRRGSRNRSRNWDDNNEQHGWDHDNEQQDWNHNNEQYGWKNNNEHHGWDNNNEQHEQTSPGGDNNLQNNPTGWELSRYESPKRRSRGGRSPTSRDQDQNNWAEGGRANTGWGSDNPNNNTWLDEYGDQNEGQQSGNHGRNRRQRGNRRNRRQGGRGRSQNSPRRDQGGYSHSQSQAGYLDFEPPSDHKANEPWW